MNSSRIIEFLPSLLLGLAAQLFPEYRSLIFPIAIIYVISIIVYEIGKKYSLWQRLGQWISTQLQRLGQWISTHWKRVIAGVFFIISLVACGITYISQPHTPPAPVTPSKFTILVAGFAGVKEDNNIRGILINRLRGEMKGYKIVESQIKPQSEVKDPESDPEYNPEDIKEQYGKQGNAYISASYTASIYTLIYHFVLLHPPKDMPKFDFTRELTIHLPPSSEEKTNFINEMGYLSRFALGMNYYEEGESETEDMKKRIEQFSSAIKLLNDASNQKLSHEPALDKKLVLCYQGIAYYKQGRIKESQDILKQSQETLKQASLDGSGIKFPEGCPYGTKDVLYIAPVATSSGGGGGGSLLSR